jgi:glycosyltransferase involved in cell wall biosynthesis
MKASIIIPTFNRSALLYECIETLLNQSISTSEYEILIVDNNSTDDTFEITKQFVQKYNNIKYVKEVRPGLVYGRHAGAKAASHECLIYADDDGLYNRSCVAEMLKVYADNPKVLAVGGKIEILWDKKPPEWILEREYLLGKLDYGSQVVISNSLYINGGLFSIRKTTLFELNGFNPDQIGDYLVGDGESGLCVKIHKKNYLIGWTPNAIMMHQQFVDKQGTVKDMGRRYYNYGVCISYGKMRISNFKFTPSAIRYFIKTFVLLVKDYLEYFILMFTKKKLIIYFKLMHKKGEFAFFRHLSSKQFKEYCRNDNWF